MRLRAFYERHHRTLWILHSIWAICAGLVVVLLAQKSHDYASWVLGFLILTWFTTIGLSRVSLGPPDSTRAKLGRDFVSYLTREMHQATLFFVLPFYFYSATLDGVNIVFVALLAGLAVFACIDLVFDELLRKKHWFGMAFFAFVAFATLNFLLPLVFGLRLDLSMLLAAAIAIAAAVPEAYQRGERTSRGAAKSIGAAALLVVALFWWGRPLIPPAPLQLEKLVFARDVRPESLEVVGELSGSAALGEVSGRLTVVATIFAPRRVDTLIEVHWTRDGEPVKVSRELEISAHEAGFRVWDAFAPEEGLEPGTYRVSVETVGGQLVGRRDLELGVHGSG